MSDTHSRPMHTVFDNPESKNRLSYQKTTVLLSVGLYWVLTYSTSSFPLSLYAIEQPMCYYIGKALNLILFKSLCSLFSKFCSYGWFNSISKRNYHIQIIKSQFSTLQIFTSVSTRTSSFLSSFAIALVVIFVFSQSCVLLIFYQSLISKVCRNRQLYFLPPSCSVMALLTLFSLYYLQRRHSR